MRTVGGGVAGGMSCAARARRLDEDAEIIVRERGPFVSFADCGLPSYVGAEIADRDTLLVQTPRTLKGAYGPAKDAINLAGMLGANVLDGTLRLWDARDLDTVRSDALVVDVRTAAEVATGMLRGALHIPHTELRERLDEVREAAAGRPVRVLCASGVRSAIAHRVLAQAGFDSASLPGGMLTLRAALADRADRVLAPYDTRILPGRRAGIDIPPAEVEEREAS